MMVLDTTILIDALRSNRAALRKIAEIEAAEETVCTTQVNVLELFKGAYLSARSDEGVQKVRKLLEAFVILCIDEETYECFAALSAQLKSRGKPTNDFDELIAAIVMTNGAAIVTRDEHFLHIPGLRPVKKSVA